MVDVGIEKAYPVPCENEAKVHVLAHRIHFLSRHIPCILDLLVANFSFFETEKLRLRIDGSKLKS
jgi:hypothetical protein